MTTLGKVGSRLACPPNTFAEIVVRADSDNPRGETWSIQLSAWQTSNNSGRNTTAVTSLRARIEVGAEGANDLFDVDYPAQGVAFCVQGQTLTVTLVGDGGLDAFGPNTNPRPIIGAWATTVSSATKHTATFTTDQQVIADTSTVFVNIPARARSYQLSFVNNTGGDPGGGTLSMLQRSGHGPPRDLLTDVVLDTAAGDIDFWAAPSSRGSSYPLHPQAQTIAITNSSGVTQRVILTFALDTAA